MRGLCRFGIIALLALTFGALPFVAAADAPSCATTNAMAPLWMARPGGGGGGVTEQSTCVANCGSTSVSTICAGTCTATDVNCPYTNGYVTCNGVYTYCPTTCPSLPDCQASNGTYCAAVGSKMSCLTSDNFVSQCTCRTSHTWLCPY